MRRFLRNNGLSLVLIALFLGTYAGQSVVGHRHHNDGQREHGQPDVTYTEYVTSPEFLESTMENWESEFLQMATYVILTAVFFQRGSSESKDPDKDEAVDREPDPNREGAPGPVKKGGWQLALYRNSLSITLGALFLVSMALHAVGGAGEYNKQQADHGQPERVTALQYLGTSKFWFESLQNWQSEFLSIALMVILSIFLRQHGSPESKPVDAAHSETGVA